jgi:hypothetical protein
MGTERDLEVNLYSDNFTFASSTMDYNNMQVALTMTHSNMYKLNL